jgi:hypothetical protein
MNIPSPDNPRSCFPRPLKHTVQRVGLLWLFSLACFIPVTAQDPAAPAPQTTACSKKGKTFNETISCLKHLYDKITGGPIHLVHGSVVPGSGVTGGIGYTNKSNTENWRKQFDTSARISVKKYWEFDANLRLSHNVNKFTDDDVTGPSGNLKLNLYALVKDAPRLDFFGLGPESTKHNRTVFHYREAVVGLDAAKPFRRWLDLGGAVEGIWPDIVTIKNPTVNSSERVYSEASAPGITTQPGFLHLVAFAGLHSPGQPESRHINYRFFFHAYQDLTAGRYSFRRFDADLNHKFPFEKNELRVRGRLSFTETSGGQRAPFYLMETLGGSNIRSEDTLRGFSDYRFRDRDFALLQIEYLREIYGPIDFITFYDAGKVAASVSRFSEGRLRQTFGLGIVVVPRRADNILFRFYVALGSGEGSHTFIGGGVTGRGDRLVR